MLEPLARPMARGAFGTPSRTAMPAYERVWPGGQRAQIDFLYGPGEPCDRVKFPDGLGGLARKIKQAGLRPAT